MSWQIKRVLVFGTLASCGLVLVIGLYLFTMSAATEDGQTATSIYDFSAKDIDGNEVSLEKYRGDVVIIVNVASK